MNGGLALEIGLARPGFELEVELTVEPGETVVLVGPSGSGKTTTLRAIAGLVRPDRGRITIAGRAVLDTERRIDLPPWERRVGYVFQDYALFPHLTVEQNLRYGLRSRDANSGDRVREWLQALGIAELAHRRPDRLSGGQQQRVALARAAVSDSDLLLLDEPFGSLDAATRRSVRNELRDYLRRAARTALLVSHDYLDALTLGDRIAVLEEGRLVQVGSREEVLRRPRTPFLAALTGHNVLEGTLQPPAPGAEEREAAAGPLRFHVAGGTELPAGPVFLAFGPQEVTLLREAPGAASLSARNRFPATVREIVPLPDRLRVYLDAGLPLMADVVPSAAAELGLREGAPVTAAIKSTAIEVYR
ncbi:MAG: ABC transporter ATP-binding protein [Armatimonadota bacterium]